MSNRGFKKKKIIRIWCPRWWSHQIRSSSEGIVTRGLYSYLKNCFWMQKMQFWRFLKKLQAANFFVNWFRKCLPRPFQRCRNCQWCILFHLNFVLHHCGAPWPTYIIYHLHFQWLAREVCSSICYFEHGYEGWWRESGHIRQGKIDREEKLGEEPKSGISSGRLIGWGLWMR